jgi:hypothetical protein
MYVYYSPPPSIMYSQHNTDYELVRLHHPDAPACRHIPPAERHSRFQAISSAYDTLRGRRPHTSSHHTSGSNAFEAELARRRRNTRGHEHYQRDWGFDFPGDGSRHGQGRTWDETDPAHKWKDRVLVISGGIALALGLGPMFAAPFTVGDKRHRAALAHLQEARAEAKEYGQERRAAIKERVAEERARKEKEQTDEERLAG